MTLLVIGIAAVAAIALLLQHMRRTALMKKYGDAALVNQIMRKMIWQGHTSEQLIDAIGKLVAIDQQVMKAKVRETWKYQQRTKTQFGLRVTVENGNVTGWSKKD